METNSPIKAAVIGAGAWGTALAQQLARCGQQVTIWAYEPEVAQAINDQHENTVFLPGLPLHQSLSASSDLVQVLAGAELVVLVMPSHVYRTVLGQAAEHLPERAVIVSCSKGIEADTGYSMCEVAADALPKSFHRRLAALSGPSFAKEVAAGAPTAVTVASRDQAAANTVQQAFAGPLFRVYTSPDLVGVELGGAVKNPLAIAAGMVVGLELGHNAMAATITRGLAEMTRLALAKGGQMATMAGLAGLGDLVLTCTGSLSRNRTVGSRLAQGESIDQITTSMRQVAEGVKNTRTVLALAQRSGVDMPIIKAVHSVIYEGKAPIDALYELMGRELKPESYT
jgi:glycerol-3-phosphate dehydrogenase (NAD(P)+)